MSKSDRYYFSSGRFTDPRHKILMRKIDNLAEQRRLDHLEKVQEIVESIRRHKTKDSG